MGLDIKYVHLVGCYGRCFDWLVFFCHPFETYGPSNWIISPRIGGEKQRNI